MTYNRRRNLGWAMRDERLRARATAEDVAGIRAMDVSTPAPTIHFGWLTGWKSRQEFTACGLRAKGLPRLEQVDLVTCEKCLGKVQPSARAVGLTQE